MPAQSELFTVQTPDTARARLWEAMGMIVVQTERVATAHALGRVLASDVHSQEDLPAFDRSAVDGYAVIAADTHGASAGLPALLTVMGEAAMGQPTHIAVQTGQAVLIHTGGMVPADADAVVMVEHTQSVTPHQTSVTNSPFSILHFSNSLNASIEVMRPVAAGENIIKQGEDMRIGGVVLPRGQILRPQDIGGLMALGMTEIDVARQLHVGLISSGDEVVAPTMQPTIGQVRDVNAYALAAAVQRSGGVPVQYGIVPDDFAQLRTMATRAKAECDLVVLSAGSSVSVRDMSVTVIGELGQPGVLVHGVSVKPGKPTIIALCDGVPVFGLPGNPASALVIFDLFVAPTLRRMMGANVDTQSALPRPQVQARLTRNIPSTTGREDYVQVALEQTGTGEWQATPIFGKSNLIFTLIQAHGTVQVPIDVSGYRAGDVVTVWL